MIVSIHARCPVINNDVFELCSDQAATLCLITTSLPVYYPLGLARRWAEPAGHAVVLLAGAAGRCGSEDFMVLFISAVMAHFLVR